ncbi:MAG TPA: 50S ribosomal protein L11 [Candidatus Nanoarchaeia archaeon]|nr:50S ribosomal protein L11 [Candidatus Nanoarchaeia archaeon]
MAKIKLIVEGGAMKPGPAVAQQLGPMGINLGKVIADVNSATSGFKGMEVPVEIDVDGKTKSFTVKVFSPSVATLLKKEIATERGSGSAKEVKVGNLAIEQIISVAKTKQSALLSRTLKSAVKLVVGTCVSLGILVESKDPKQVEKDIDAGMYDKEIKSEKTDVSAEKKKELQTFFAAVKDKQEKAKKAAEEAAAAAEAAKAAAAAAAPAAGVAPAAGAAAPAGATPAAGAKAATPAKDAKPAAKK